MNKSFSVLKEEKKEANNNLYTVVKRNGTLVPFNRARILYALESAFRDTKKFSKESPLEEELQKVIENLTDLIVRKILKLASKGTRLTVEGIQDVVEVTLMKNGYHDVAKDYIIYRDHRKLERDQSLSNLKILRHDKSTLVKFNPIKITSSIEQAFRKTKKIPSEDNSPEELIASVNELTEKVLENVKTAVKNEEELSVAMIQDFIETFLMESKFFDVAKDYILQRAEKEKDFIERQKKYTDSAGDKKRKFKVKTSENTEKTITESQIKQKISFACRSLDDLVSASEVFETSVLNFYDGMKENELDLSNIMAARSKIEKEPAYSKVAARLLLDCIHRETLQLSSSDPSLTKTHESYFKKYIKEGIKLKRVSEDLLGFDLDELSAAIDLTRDDLFSYLGLQTLYDRYFIHHENKKLETPQIFWMRVAMGLAINESEKNKRAIEFYNILSQFYFTSSTPTLFNSGTCHPQLSSCYLSTIMDNLHNIFKVVADDAQLSKWAGGLGNDWTNVRSTGSVIKGTNGKSQGVIPFLKVANDTAVAVNQGGKRKGAMCAYLETWHLDIEDFLELRKNTGDERRRTPDMNTANWIPDLFMKRVKEKKGWTLFSPSDAKDLHDLYGKAFEERYQEYEKMSDDGKIKVFKKVDASLLWRKMLSMLFETGHPWITFKDPSNIRSPQDHIGTVHSSNLCTEILLNTSETETAVCNLGSINLANHIEEDKIDEKKLAKTIRTAIRMLDNVIDINFYPIPEAKYSNLKHRPIGLGLMGFQDALYIKQISYASAGAVEFADNITEMISYYAILSSSELAKEKGKYSTYGGSKWSRGLLPIDTIELLEKERGSNVNVDKSSKMDWSHVREHVKKHGMRNSNTMAIAPTATIANITGITQSIEPMYKHLFVKSNLSGEFTVINPYLVDVLKKHNLWDDEMIDDLKYFDGSIAEIERIPDEIKRRFPVAFEVEPEWLIECASRRQKWIDMGQSLNLYLAEPNGKKLSQMYMLSWEMGLKTNYYLRSLGATQIEKSSMDINKRGIQPRWMKNKSASSDIKVDRSNKPVPVCNLEEGCESCQ